MGELVTHFPGCPSHVGGACTCAATSVLCPHCGDEALELAEARDRELEMATFRDSDAGDRLIASVPTNQGHVNELERALEQACRDLQQAHNEVLRAQGCDEAKFLDYAWPSWTPQANTIRWAEKLLGKPLGKRTS